MLINRESKVWAFLGENLQGLISDGERLLDDVKLHEQTITDYSYVVFPFSKAYEGFLKKLFLSLKLITKDEFYGDEVRIGRILNPTYKGQNSVYSRIPRHLPDRDLSEYLWYVWKNGRNLIFHYYPHNFRKLSLKDAQALISDIIQAMEEASELLQDGSEWVKD